MMYKKYYQDVYKETDTALSVQEFLARKQITLVDHLPYSPDPAPNDFFIYPEIKEVLKVRHFDDIDAIKAKTTADLKTIPESVSKLFRRVE